MKKRIFQLVLIILIPGVFMTQLTFAQEKEVLSVQYEELTAVQFVTAVQKSAGTCVIPFGVLEKHGPHLPLGTDLLDAREIALRAANKEYTIVFPAYYFGQIFEAKHQPGTIAYSDRIIWDLLQETCDELARNGITKIIIKNGHGGNNNFLKYFCQVQLARRRNYVVYLFAPQTEPEVAEKIDKIRKSKFDHHAGEEETSMMLAHRPELVHLETAESQSGSDQARIKDLPFTYTAIWWYAQYPNHYAGNAKHANAQLGELIIDDEVKQLVQMLRAVKADTKVLELQNQFFDEGEKPLETKQ